MKKSIAFCRTLAIYMIWYTLGRCHLIPRFRATESPPSLGLGLPTEKRNYGRRFYLW